MGEECLELGGGQNLVKLHVFSFFRPDDCMGGRGGGGGRRGGGVSIQ